MATSAGKERANPQYELLYHPAIPGRGEYIRLSLEAARVPYSDPANQKKGGYDIVLAACDKNSTGDEDGNPPVFCPPALRVLGEGKDGKDLLIHQTPNILLYLGPKIGMVPEEDEVAKLHINQLTLTALDLSNETHNTHHPISSMLYYEDQKEESLKKAKDFRENRIPKFFDFFERVLKGNKEGKGNYLVGEKLTYADTTLWQVIDGIYFAFPREMSAVSKKFPLIFDTFYPGIKEEKGIKEYLASDRRLPYSMGLFRKYPELDRQ